MKQIQMIGQPKQVKKEKGIKMMNFLSLKQSYQEQLIRAGVPPQKAEQAAKALTVEELQFISEIWPEWNTVFCDRLKGKK